jgi:hypothetical protein
MSLIGIPSKFVGWKDCDTILEPHGDKEGLGPYHQTYPEGTATPFWLGKLKFALQSTVSNEPSIETTVILKYSFCIPFQTNDDHTL